MNALVFLALFPISAFAGGPVFSFPFETKHLLVTKVEWTGLAEGSRIGQGAELAVLENDSHWIQIGCGGKNKSGRFDCRLTLKNKAAGNALCLAYVDFYQTGTEAFLGHPSEFIQSRLEMDGEDDRWGVGARYTMKVGDAVEAFRLGTPEDVTSMAIQQSVASRSFTPNGWVEGEVMAMTEVECGAGK
jgi:hypothetical protein